MLMNSLDCSTAYSVGTGC